MIPGGTSTKSYLRYCEMLFDIEQGPKEGTGRFLERFMHAF